MSTKLKSIKDTELGDDHTVTLTQFGLGKIGRVGIQIGQMINGEHRYIQLSEADAMMLCDRLIKWTRRL